MFGVYMDFNVQNLMIGFKHSYLFTIEHNFFNFLLTPDLNYNKSVRYILHRQTLCLLHPFKYENLDLLVQHSFHTCSANNK